MVTESVFRMKFVTLHRKPLLSISVPEDRIQKI